MRRLIICMMLTFVLFTCFTKDAICETEEMTQQAREHISRHNAIPLEIVNRMYVSKTWNIDHRMWLLRFRYFDFSEDVFELWIDNGRIYYCNCQEFSQESIQDGLSYYNANLTSAIALEKWEEQHGPYVLWDVELNAQFYAEYGHIPAETMIMYHEPEFAHCDLPSLDDLSLNDARVKAEKILFEHFQVGQGVFLDNNIGSYFYNNESKDSYYYFRFVSQSAQGKMTLQYYVIIRSPDGRCLTAARINQESLCPEDIWIETEAD